LRDKRRLRNVCLTNFTLVLGIFGDIAFVMLL